MARHALLLISISIALLSTTGCERGSETTPPSEPQPATPESSAGATAEPAPQSPEQICAHARDRNVELGELDMQAAVEAAPEDQKSMAEALGLEIVGSVRDNFVEACVILEGEELECMANIDGYADASVSAKRGGLDCQRQAEDPRECDTWYEQLDAARAEFGECYRVVEQTTIVAIEVGQDDEGGTFLASPYGGTFVEEDDEEDPWGGLDDAESYGVGGLGLTGTGASVPTVRQAKAKVDGAIDSDIVRRIVRAHISEVRRCYDAGLKRDPKLAGTLTVEFTIGADGKVRASEAVDAFGDPKVAKCVVEAIKTWKFVKPSDGGEVQVRYPFELAPG